LYARRRQKHAASHVLVAEATIAAFASALASYIAVGTTSQRRMGMPRALLSGDFRAPRAATVFTVDGAVGRNAPNDRLDVLLVQFLLHLSTNDGWWNSGNTQPTLTVPRGLRVATPVVGTVHEQSLSGSHPKPQGNIIIDGICGDQTIGFIEYFQEQMQLRRIGVELNGQVVPQQIRGTTTMSLLNETLRRLGQPWMLDQSGAFPKELANSFYF